VCQWAVFFINRRPKTVENSICHESICPITDGGEGVHVILSGILFAKATVNNVGGIILLPNNWDASTYELNDTDNFDGGFESNIITAVDWTNLFEANGAVFLPAAGYRNGTSVYNSGYDGFYWSSSYCNYNSAYRLSIGSNMASNQDRDTGCSVRLVRNAE
jgi:hypothetical protein